METSTTVAYDPMEPAPKVENLEQLVAELHKIFSQDDVCVDYVMDLMTNFKSNIKEWKKFAKFDRYRYTRNLIDMGNENFNVILVCWGPSHQSSIHDHTNSHCFMKLMDGNLEEVRYEWPQEGEKQAMVQSAINSPKLNEVVYINDEVGLHRVQNPSNSEEAVSLHIYSPPFGHCQIFDERTGNKTKCKMSFWSKNGTKLRNEQKNSCRC